MSTSRQGFPRLLRGSLIITLLLAAGLPLAAAADSDPAAGKPLLGVAVINPAPPWHGALVARIAADSAAAQSGLQPQDLIVAVDSQTISSAQDLTAYVATRHAGDRLTLGVIRQNGVQLGRIVLVATLGVAPAAPAGGNLAAASAPGENAAVRPAPSSPSRAESRASSRTASRAPAQGLTNVSWTRFTDPYEQAFSIEVPQGWKVAGGIVRKNPLWPNAVVRVLSPDRNTLIAIGDPDGRPYDSPMDARPYVQRFTESAMSSACSGLSISDVAELPDVERFASARSLVPYQWSAAQASFSCDGRQSGMTGKAIAVLQFMPSTRSGHAQVLAAYVTTSGQGDAADELLNHMVSSVQQDPGWSAREQGQAGQLAAGAMARWQGEQQQFQQMDDAITDTAHYVSPDGQHYDLDSRPNYQWRLPNGQTVGTNTPTPPVPGATQLQKRPE